MRAAEAALSLKATGAHLPLLVMLLLQLLLMLLLGGVCSLKEAAAIGDVPLGGLPDVFLVLPPAVREHGCGRGWRAGLDGRGSCSIGSMEGRGAALLLPPGAQEEALRCHVLGLLLPRGSSFS